MAIGLNDTGRHETGLQRSELLGGKTFVIVAFCQATMVNQKS